MIVEAVTLEEAALLWGAIDPLDHEGVRLRDIGNRLNVSPERYKAANLFQRAAVEAVCSGTLSFESSWEAHSDWQSDWEKKVEFPDLPDATKILPHLTRVKLAALQQWAANKRILSYRQILKRQQGQNVLEAVIEVSKPIHSSGEVLLLPLDKLRDPSNLKAPVELRVAVDVWEETQTQAEGPEGIEGVSVKQAITKNLERHPEREKLSAEAKKRIATVANWDRDGGAPKTPGN